MFRLQTDIKTKTLIRVTKYLCKFFLRHSLFLVYRNLLVCLFFFLFLCALLTLWWKALRCLPLLLHSLLDSTKWWRRLRVNTPKEQSQHMWQSPSCLKDSCKDGRILQRVRVTLRRPGSHAASFFLLPFLSAAGFCILLVLLVQLLSRQDNLRQLWDPG